MVDATKQPLVADGDWLAPTVTVPGGAHARVEIPGSKSLTNRYLLLAALADSPSVIHAPLHSRDSQLMVAALTALGARFEEIETGSAFGPDLRVTPLDFSATAAREASIDVGLAGTVMRFVPPVAALLPGTFHFDGDEHARVRPMLPVIEALRGLGVEVEDAGTGSLPFTVESSGSVQVAELTIDASGSSQFVSALLLAACRFERGLVLRHVGGPVPSIPHIEMTVETMRELGISVDFNGTDTWTVAPGGFPGFEVTVEPDLSNAGPFLVAAVATGATVTVPRWPASTTQGGDHWRKILPLFGAQVKLANGDLTVTGPTGGVASGLPGVDLDLAEAGELAPTVAALIALSPATSVLSGIAHLRGHETDRLAALTTEINRLGGRAEETEDGIRVTEPVAHGALMRTYADHRMATAAAVMGLVVPGVVVENVEATSKTLPNFTGLWQNMLDQWQAGAA
ncbi:3-phosphoshikimate 1-carboxyvinyltransferase [Rothia sp. SD9660Na]|uniref:3-phosphoshikimate 1-carboxyvinyltransferase n=1 Tax=Rothia sp. SD9660Na TaxID=3047030 RepID=UPI0024BB48FB|nr:3-phosphoshikimate 1-carboxyvinyltransferase [Rothia sp. SD9660Na]WHS51126.1 3-phosphoshikimate 1-carboxyvinyltransferase [Rothia sp. SD9660Na]